MTAVMFSRYGDPATVLELSTAADPPLGDNDVAFRMHFAPINPADLNLISGTYGVKPELPACAGVEGVGEITALGRAVTTLAIGDWVRPVDGVGTWRRHGVAAAERFHRLPRLRDPQQAAMLAVNPATAWRLLHDVVPLRAGDWILLNAAGSNLGRCVLQLARDLGFRCAATVRRREIAAELQALGATVVCADDRNAAAALSAACGSDPARLAINLVGGDSALTQAKALAVGGTVVTVGGLSRQPLTIGAGQLIFKDLRFTGLWVSRWYSTATRAERDAMFAQLATRCDDGRLHQPVATVFPLSAWRTAVAALAASAGSAAAGSAAADSAAPDHQGKILFDCRA